MRLSRLPAVLLPLLLSSALSACGNKGNLVKPTPSALPPPEKTDSTQTPPSTPPDAEQKPAQDSGGH
jgi:predicted small lipoprotein YifL